MVLPNNIVSLKNPVDDFCEETGSLTGLDSAASFEGNLGICNVVGIDGVQGCYIRRSDNPSQDRNLFFAVNFDYS